MQGLWKNNVSGYNKKGDKRKRQSHKKFVKDKYRSVVKKFVYGKSENLSVYREGSKSVFYRDAKRIPQEAYVFVWNISIGNKEKIAWEYKGLWYDDFTDERLNIKVGFEVKRNFIIEQVPIEVEKQKEHPLREIKSFNIYSKKERLLYNKPFPIELERMSFWVKKKYSRQKANRKDRVRLRNWLANWDFDKPIKTHELSKSILWDIC